MRYDCLLRLYYWTEFFRHFENMEVNLLDTERKIRDFTGTVQTIGRFKMTWHKLKKLWIVYLNTKL